MKFIKRFVNFYQNQEWTAFWSTTACVFVALLIVALWLVDYEALPSQIPLFNSLPWGDAQLASSDQYFILPAIIILITFVNLIVSWHLHSSQLAIKRVLYLSSLISSFIIFIASFKIIFTLI